MVAEFCGARVRAAVEAPRDSREDDRGEQVHNLGTWVLKARPRGARTLDDAFDCVNFGVVRENT